MDTNDIILNCEAPRIRHEALAIISALIVVSAYVNTPSINSDITLTRALGNMWLTYFIYLVELYVGVWIFGRIRYIRCIKITKYGTYLNHRKEKISNKDVKIKIRKISNNIVVFKSSSVLEVRVGKELVGYIKYNEQTYRTITKVLGVIQ